MKLKQFFCLLLVLCIAAAPICVDAAITSTPTGYKSAADVEYVIQNGTVVNWGARDEDATFLTTYAQDYYAGSYTYDAMSALSGGTGTSDAYSSELYLALQALMRAKHTNRQGYQDTRPYYCYTDCVRSDFSQISSFYSGKLVNGTWNGQTYNREHIWPKSKCINTKKADDSADIMMLRATISSENSSRGNSAYGESGGYFEPGADVRGDCARMVLYGYVRWGNTGKMWGTSGVMESMEVLLKWMEEDPVDTWEMGRNDAVQSITGVRNVFVDYPEYAWLIFGQAIPSGLVTPSAGAEHTPAPCAHKNVTVKNASAAACTQDGYSGDTYCADCGVWIANGSVIPAMGHKDDNTDYVCDICGETTGTPPTEPAPTEPPATEPPATEPPATEPPATEPPATEPPATEPTEPSASTPPSSEPTEPSSPAPTGPEDPQKMPAPNTLWIIAIVAVLCIGAGIAILIVIKRRVK